MISIKSKDIKASFDEEILKAMSLLRMEIKTGVDSVNIFDQYVKKEAFDAISNEV